MSWKSHIALSLTGIRPTLCLILFYVASSAFPFTRIALLPIWATDCKRVGHQYARCRASAHWKEAGFIPGVIMPYSKRDRPTFTEEVQRSEAAAFATALGRRRLASAPRSPIKSGGLSQVLFSFLVLLSCLPIFRTKLRILFHCCKLSGMASKKLPMTSNSCGFTSFLII